MLRYNLQQTSNEVNLEKELNYVKQYLFIQKIRFGERIKYKINIDPCLMDLKLPFFTLQPLVENAIIHGLEPKESGGKLSVIGKCDQERIELIVQDDGVGIPKDKVEMIKAQTMIKKGQTVKVEGIGLANVQKRLKLFFGEQCDFSIASREGHGTAVTLVFDMGKFKCVRS